MLERTKFCQELLNLLRGNPRFLRFQGDIHLDQNVQGPVAGSRVPVQFRGQRQPVHGFNHIKELAACLALLLCRWPMKCQRMAGSSRGIFSMASWTKFSPKRFWPH